MEHKIERVYAGFWMRVVASFIDVMILIFPSMIIDEILGSGSITSIILLLLLGWIYSAKMLSSSWKATIGKKMVGIEVENLEGNRLTFKEASVRFVLSIVSYGLLLPIFIMWFTEKKQTFHDYYAKTIVLDNVAMYSDESYTGIKVVRFVGLLLVVAIAAVQVYTLGLFIMFGIAMSVR